jgi:hypothetical protein
MEFETTVTVEIDADDIIMGFYGDMDELLREMDIEEIISYLTDNLEVDSLLNRIDNETIIKYMCEESGGSAEMLDAIPNDVTIDYVVHNIDNDAILREVNDDAILRYVTTKIPIAHIRRAFEASSLEIVDKDEKEEKPTLLSILKSSALTPHSHRLLLTSEEKTWLFGNLEATDLINAIFARGLTLSLMEEFIKKSVKLGTDQRLVATQEENNNG